MEIEIGGGCCLFMEEEGKLVDPVVQRGRVGAQFFFNAFEGDLPEGTGAFCDGDDRKVVAIAHVWKKEGGALKVGDQGAGTFGDPLFLDDGKKVDASVFQIPDKTLAVQREMKVARNLFFLSFCPFERCRFFHPNSLRS
jgi:hypothetical protein